ncbi:na+-driven multidrug efflux pump domain protein [Vibrio parahaemolyticus VPTS-2010]|nr:na+-driven multidrug efflux pump domain protein [Vibrio parahaemolyticus VPTS-2010]
MVCVSGAVAYAYRHRARSQHALLGRHRHSAINGCNDHRP